MNWRCALGRHDWNLLGRCHRCWRVSGISDLAESLAPGASGRAYDRRVKAAGEDLQHQMRLLGHEVTLELCKDMARQGKAEMLLSRGRDLASRGVAVR